jgi:hypothetical protein
MNKREIVTRALRELGVVGYQRSPNGQMYEVGEEKLAQLYADINGPWGGMTLTFGLEDDCPAAYQDSMIDLLAARLSRQFERTPPMPEITALMRMRAVNKPYVRDMDFDDDGIVDEAEEDAIDMSRYF